MEFPFASQSRSNGRDGAFRRMSYALEQQSNGSQTFVLDHASVVFGGAAVLSDSFPPAVRGSVTQVGAVVTVMLTGTFVQTSLGVTTITVTPDQIAPSAVASPLAGLDRALASGLSIATQVLTPTASGVSVFTVTTTAPSAINFSVTYTYVAANPFTQ